MPLSNLITTAITLDTIRAARAGFGKPMICGEHSIGATAAATYTSLADMITAGHATTDEIYKACVVMLSQTYRPQSWTVGKRTTAVAQVDKVTVVGTGDGDYKVTLNSVDHTFAASSNTATEIRDGLLAAVNVGSEPITASADGSDALLCTADNAGEPFTIAVTSPGSDMTTASQTANNGLYEDLALIRAADSTWWGFADIDHDDWDTMEGARWAEADTALFFAQSASAAIKATGSTDVASKLKAFSYARTAPMYKATDTEYADAAWMGKGLPRAAGSINWAWQPLAAVTGDTLTGAEVGYIKGKNCNWVENVGQVAALNGITSGGQYIDVIRGRDWLIYNINRDLADALLSADFFPMDEEGLALADTILEARLRRGVQQGIVKAGSIVTGTPLYEDLEDSDKANRKLQRDWSAVVQGKVSEFEINGTLSL